MRDLCYNGRNTMKRIICMSKACWFTRILSILEFFFPLLHPKDQHVPLVLISHCCGPAFYLLASIRHHLIWLQGRNCVFHPESIHPSTKHLLRAQWTRSCYSHETKRPAKCSPVRREVDSICLLNSVVIQVPGAWKLQVWRGGHPTWPSNGCVQICP